MKKATRDLSEVLYVNPNIKRLLRRFDDSEERFLSTSLINRSLKPIVDSVLKLIISQIIKDA